MVVTVHVHVTSFSVPVPARVATRDAAIQRVHWDLEASVQTSDPRPEAEVQETRDPGRAPPVGLMTAGLSPLPCGGLEFASFPCECVSVVCGAAVGPCRCGRPHVAEPQSHPERLPPSVTAVQTTAAGAPLEDGAREVWRACEQLQTLPEA